MHAALKERCPPRQESRVERRKEKNPEWSETKAQSGTSQSKSGTSVNSSDSGELLCLPWLGLLRCLCQIVIDWCADRKSASTRRTREARRRDPRDHVRLDAVDERERV